MILVFLSYLNYILFTCLSIQVYITYIVYDLNTLIGVTQNIRVMSFLQDDKLLMISSLILAIH